MSSPTHTGQLVLVTGAANGIGKSIVTQLAKLNFNIAAWDVDLVRCWIFLKLVIIYILYQAGLNKLKSELLSQNSSIKVSVYVVDVNNLNRVREVSL